MKKYLILQNNNTLLILYFRNATIGLSNGVINNVQNYV